MYKLVGGPFDGKETEPWNGEGYDLARGFPLRVWLNGRFISVTFVYGHRNDWEPGEEPHQNYTFDYVQIDSGSLKEKLGDEWWKRTDNYIVPAAQPT